MNNKDHLVGQLTTLTPALHHREGEGPPPWVAHGNAKFACDKKINSWITNCKLLFILRAEAIFYCETVSNRAKITGFPVVTMNEHK